jgi:hypothetical protein
MFGLRWRRQFYFIAYNVLQIAEGGDFEVETFNIAKMMIQCTTIKRR